VFIHIPKTGGSSIEKLLGLYGPNSIANCYGIFDGKALQHLTCSEILARQPITKKYYKFCVVRNPYDRLLSDYYWLPNGGYQASQSVDQYLDKVEDVVQNERYSDHIYSDHFMPQHLFVYDTDRCLVNWVGRFEQLTDTAEHIKSTFSISTNFQHINYNSDVDRVQLTQEQKDRIYNLYQKDFKLFSYQP